MEKDAIQDNLRERDGAFDQVVDRRIRRVLADQLRSTRKAAGLSQMGFSERIGVPQTTISKIERAHRDVTLLEFLAICEVLGVSPDSLIAQLLDAIDSQKLTRPGRV